MFEQANAYSGNMVAAEVGADGPISADNPAHTYNLDPHEIIKQAQAEAESIIENAKLEAEAVKQELLDKAKQEVSFEAAKMANKMATDLGLDLWSARYAISDIVEKSLNEMIGVVGQTEACFHAVNKVAKEHASEKTFKVHAEPETANRLRLIEMGRSKSPYSAKFEIVNDHSIAAGACMLDMGHKKLEVSLDAQIKAIKSAVENAVRETDLKTNTSTKNSGDNR